jgi:hypothetical protein
MADKRKKIQKDKYNKENQTFASIAKRAVEQSQLSQPKATQIQLGTETHISILTCIIEAHINNMIAPGSYASRLNVLLKANNLKTINIPGPSPDSGKLFGATIAKGLRNKDPPEEQLVPTEEVEVEDIGSDKEEDDTPTPKLPKNCWIPSDSNDTSGTSVSTDEASANNSPILTSTSSSLSSAVSAASLQLAASPLELDEEDREKDRKSVV